MIGHWVIKNRTYQVAAFYRIVINKYVQHCLFFVEQYILLLIRHLSMLSAIRKSFQLIYIRRCTKDCYSTKGFAIYLEISWLNDHSAVS